MNCFEVILVLKTLELVHLHTSIAILFTQLHGFNYCDLTLIFLLNINYLFAHGEEVSSIAI